MAFHEFQGNETRDDRFRANPYAQRRCSGVGIMLDSHLGGLLVVEVVEIVEVDHLCQILPSAAGGGRPVPVHTSTEHGRISVCGRQADTYRVWEKTRS